MLKHETVLVANSRTLCSCLQECEFVYGKTEVLAPALTMDSNTVCFFAFSNVPYSSCTRFVCVIVIGLMCGRYLEGTYSGVGTVSFFVLQFKWRSSPKDSATLQHVIILNYDFGFDVSLEPVRKAMHVNH